MLEMDGSWSQQSFQTGDKQPIVALKSSEEKNLEHLFRSVYYEMCNKVKVKSTLLPFKVLAEPLNLVLGLLPSCYVRVDSSKCQHKQVPVPDPTDAWKPDLVLMDYKLKKLAMEDKSWVDVLTGVEITISNLYEGRDIPIFLGVATKSYLIMWEQPWRRFILLFSVMNLKFRAHYLDRSGMIISVPLSIGRDTVCFANVLNMMMLVGHPSLGFDPTIHVCGTICRDIPHDDLPGGFDDMVIRAIGWVTDNEGEVYWIMAILWKSCGLFSCGTVCYHTQDKSGREYVLKDCWVDAEVLSHEESLLNVVAGVPNVVQLVKCWDVQYGGSTDCTLNICDHIYDHLPPSPIFVNKVHHCMLLTPCGLPLTTFASLPELLNVFLDLVIVLHGDLSPNNLIIHEGKGYFIDFDHAKFIQENPIPKDSRGTRLPVNCRRWQKAYATMDQDGLGTSGSLKREFMIEKNLSFKPSSFFKACCPILEEWHRAIGDALQDERDLSHDEIREILKWGLENLDSFPSPKILYPIMKLPPSEHDSPAVSTPSQPIATQPSNWLPHHSTRNNLVAAVALSSSSMPPPPPTSCTSRPPAFIRTICCLVIIRTSSPTFSTCSQLQHLLFFVEGEIAFLGLAS
ncbi:hypothetical protein DEU56DRAFT_759947 [Suillus clintonianus]|uniref:uncharacterized protein n=1 Tax=Suillus clintonianus TaxID=1904413 RepID=UPI001B8792A7|nr:uncharacterized protein DEU56DRAFT_759947 [Suillus clintonianus]KAG2123734.1 hypothetical protein DEU56DRAFT_759947 [Suillus clintonianus]